MANSVCGGLSLCHQHAIKLNSSGSHSCELVDDLTAGYAATMEKQAALPEAAIPSMEAVSEGPPLPKPQAKQEEEDNGQGRIMAAAPAPKQRSAEKER